MSDGRLRPSRRASWAALEARAQADLAVARAVVPGRRQRFAGQFGTGNVELAGDAGERPALAAPALENEGIPPADRPGSPDALAAASRNDHFRLASM